MPVHTHPATPQPSSTCLVDGHMPRRSSRLRVRRLPPPCNARVASVNPPHEPAARARTRSRASRGGSKSSQPSCKTVKYTANTVATGLLHVTAKSGSSARQLHHTSPDPARTNKRRRELDIFDHASPIVTQNQQSPRALRALKRQRISALQSHAESSSFHFPSTELTRSDPPRSSTADALATSPLSRESNNTSCDPYPSPFLSASSKHAVTSDALPQPNGAAPPTSSVADENDRPRTFSLSTGFTSSIPARSPSPVESAKPTVDSNVHQIDYPPLPLLLPTNAISQLSTSAPEAIAEESRTPSDLVPSLLESDPTAASSPPSSSPGPTEIVLPAGTDADLLHVPLPRVCNLPPLRKRSPENVDTCLWKSACQERVETVIRRYGPTTIKSIVAAEAQAHPFTQFCLYTPATYSDTEAELSCTDMISDDEDDDDDDFDLSEDDDMAGPGEPDIPGLDMMDIDVNLPEPPASQLISSFNEHSMLPPPAFPQSPYPPFVPSQQRAAPSARPRLPRLSSIPLLSLEGCPVRGSDGRTYLGRGTPIDRQRRDEWRNAMPLKFSPMYGLYMPVPMGALPPVAPPPPPIINLMPPPAPTSLMAELQFGEYDGMDGATQGFAMLPGTVPLLPPPIYTPPPAEDMWLDPALQPPSPITQDISGLVPPPNSPVTLFPQMGADGLQGQPGCGWHGGFLCLFGSCAPCAPDPGPSGMGAQMPVFGMDFVMAEQVQVPASSTLSHALG